MTAFHNCIAGSSASLNGLAAAAAGGPQASGLQSARHSLANDDDGNRCCMPTNETLKCRNLFTPDCTNPVRSSGRHAVVA